MLIGLDKEELCVSEGFYLYTKPRVKMACV